MRLNCSESIGNFRTACSETTVQIESHRWLKLVDEFSYEEMVI
jgi:hypothetical protein